MADSVNARLALGCAQLGNLFETRTDAHARAILEAAWETGIRHFDTAPHYGLGLSERRLGAFLRTKSRDQFTVSTKVGRTLVPDPDRAGQCDGEGFRVPADHRRVWDFSGAGVLGCLEASRERLGLDHIDTVLIHDPPDDHVDQAIKQAAPVLEDLRREGVIHSFGVGTKDVELLERFVRETNTDTIMLAGRYTLLDQSALDSLLPACLERGVGVLNAAIFNSGILAQPFPGATTHFEYGSAPGTVLRTAQAIAAVCAAHHTSLPAAAMAFAAAHPAVAMLVVGADDARQVRSNDTMLKTPPTPALWNDLVARSLIRADAPLPRTAD
ncbi:MAG TPA: aldo/keto reductase [Actinospica sp.]|nr:aldo/keto reductase [Actinospica sp.]